ncbi:hypothetical protein PENTCL1PPCAC_16954, partial [Pristionchus entomophagus]
MECTFVLPYYTIQRSYDFFAPNRVFTETFEFVCFNLSVLADFGTLFFSVFIAVNRLIVVIYPHLNLDRRKFAMACLFTWLLSFSFPLIFFIFKCQYRYSAENVYYNRCDDYLGKTAQSLLGIAINCSYAIVVIILLFYAGLFLKLR